MTGKNVAIFPPVKPDHVSQEDWDDVDSPELTDEDFARMRPAREVLYEQFPREVADAMLAPKRPAKKLVSLRLDRDVLDRFRATGPGWQSRINEALRKAAGL